MADQWLSIVEYARTYAISDMTIRRRIKTGRIKAVLKEGKYYIPVGPNGEIIESSPEPSKQAATASSSPKPMTLPSMSSFEDTATGLRPGASFKVIPQGVSQNIMRNEQSTVDSMALLQFCDKSMTRINSIERHLQELYHSKAQTLEAQIRLKDATISQLKQQVEDLQMLVKLMERR